MVQLSASGVDFEFVRRKGMKNIRIKVLPPDGRVVVSAPYGADRSIVRSFVSSHADWIRERQARYASMPKREPVDFASGEHFTLWGEDVILEVVCAEGRSSAKLQDGVLHMKVPVSWGSDRRREVFERFLKRELQAKMDEVVPAMEQRCGLAGSSYSIRKMTSRWGSCSTPSGEIRFALRLAEYPPECLEMVVVHELGHLKYPDHGDGFKAHMDANCPDWRKIRKIMV